MAMTRVVGLAEAAEEIFLTSRTNFNMHRRRYNKPGQCPPESMRLACGPIWIGPDVVALERWAKEMAKMTAAKEKQTVANKATAAKKAATVTAKKVAAGKPTKKVAAAKKAPVAKQASRSLKDVPAKPVAKKSAAKKAAATKPVAKKAAAPVSNPSNISSIFGKKVTA